MANFALHDEIGILMDFASTIESNDVMEEMTEGAEAVPEDVSLWRNLL